MYIVNLELELDLASLVKVFESSYDCQNSNGFGSIVVAFEILF